MLISRDEVHGLFAGVLNDVDRDVVTFTARIDGAIARLASLEILRKSRDDEDSYTVSPVITAVMTASVITELQQQFELLLSGGSTRSAERRGRDPRCLSSSTCPACRSINWGVFDGYHSIPFSEGGALIAGASGSGKSSLLDAISLGFLPFNRRNFNASGDNSAAGSSAGRRTVDKYVRGAWGQRSEAAPARSCTCAATAPHGPPWPSPTPATPAAPSPVWCSNGLPANHVRTPRAGSCWPTATATSRTSATGGRPGRFDAGVFKDDDWRFSTKVESQYLAQLYATIGIRASDAAQQLLGKAKSLKSVGGLEQFVREFMLDEPSSLTRLPDALKQIDPLVDARELLAVAQRKRKILGDIEKIQQRYGSESSDLGIIDLVDQPMVRAYTDHVRLAQCPTQIDSLDTTIDQLGNEYEDVTRSAESGQGRGVIRSTPRSADPAPASGRCSRRSPRPRRRPRRSRAVAPPTRRCCTARTSTSRTPPTSSGICARNSAPQANELLAKLDRGREASTDAEYAQKVARIARDDASQGTAPGRARRVGAARVRDHDARPHLRRSRRRRRASCPTSPS